MEWDYKKELVTLRRFGFLDYRPPHLSRMFVVASRLEFLTFTCAEKPNVEIFGNSLAEIRGYFRILRVVEK